VGHRLSASLTPKGETISWLEHIIDGPDVAGFALTGGDGLVMGDLDNDGIEDIVSVHESDTEYDSSIHDSDFIPEPAGYVRVAFGSDSPRHWTTITVAEGRDSPSPEDAALADVNGDGYLDIVVAAEQSHLIYLQNPGKQIRTSHWPRLILPMTVGRGSYLRVFSGDFNGDGIPEIVAANKGAQRPGPKDYATKNPVSIFQVKGNPLAGESWHEQELGRYSVPQNSEPVDLDGDGDLDIVVGTRGEQRIIFFENISSKTINFVEHAIIIESYQMAGFNLEYADINRDGRLDIIGATAKGLIWIEQPVNLSQAWAPHYIGTFAPDYITGLELADIDGDGHLDILAGGYSRSSRTEDGKAIISDPLGRMGWFKNPGKDSPCWPRADISRRERGMFDKFIARDLDGDNDLDFVGTRGNSASFDGVFWLEQVRSKNPVASFKSGRSTDSPEVTLPGER
ncbi:MAG: hypothetical protein ACI9VI_002123, partial [Candidatus Azotimanducaceae bacterium]